MLDKSFQRYRLPVTPAGWRQTWGRRRCSRGRTGPRGPASTPHSAGCATRSAAGTHICRPEPLMLPEARWQADFWAAMWSGSWGGSTRREALGASCRRSCMVGGLEAWAAGTPWCQRTPGGPPGNRRSPSRLAPTALQDTPYDLRNKQLFRNVLSVIAAPISHTKMRMSLGCRLLMFFDCSWRRFISHRG